MLVVSRRAKPRKAGVIIAIGQGFAVEELLYKIQGVSVLISCFMAWYIAAMVDYTTIDGVKCD